MVVASVWLSIISVHKDDPDGLARTFSRMPLTTSGLEHIVIDGSSNTDIVGEVSQQTNYWPSRVVHQPPAGIYEAMNAGLHAAHGEHVMFINAGDGLHSRTVLEDLKITLADERHAWAYGRVAYVSGAGAVRISPEFQYARERAHNFRRGRFPMQPATVARTEVLRALGGFDTSFRIAADYHLMLRLAREHDPLPMDAVLTEFTLGGASSQRWIRSLTEAHRARVQVFQLDRFGRTVDCAANGFAVARAVGSRLLRRV